MKFETAPIPFLGDIFVAVRRRSCLIKPPSEETKPRPLYYGVHNNGLDYAHRSYLRNGLHSLVKQRGFHSVM